MGSNGSRDDKTRQGTETSGRETFNDSSGTRSRDDKTRQGTETKYTSIVPSLLLSIRSRDDKTRQGTETNTLIPLGSTFI